jgi:hypothetical protein
VAVAIGRRVDGVDNGLGTSGLGSVEKRLRSGDVGVEVELLEEDLALGLGRMDALEGDIREQRRLLRVSNS